jgi:hypothetical protein
LHRSPSGGIQVLVEGGFKPGVGEEGPRVGDEAGSLGDGGRVGAVRVGPVEEEGEAAVAGLDGVRAPGGGVGRVDAKNGVGIGLAAGHAAALGGEEDVGGGAEILGARGGGVGGEGLGAELLAALEVLRH